MQPKVWRFGQKKTLNLPPPGSNRRCRHPNSWRGGISCPGISSYPAGGSRAGKSCFWILNLLRLFQTAHFTLIYHTLEENWPQSGKFLLKSPGSSQCSHSSPLFSRLLSLAAAHRCICFMTSLPPCTSCQVEIKVYSVHFLSVAKFPAFPAVDLFIFKRSKEVQWRKKSFSHSESCFLCHTGSELFCTCSEG